MPPIVPVLDSIAAVAARWAFKAAPGVAMHSNGDRTPCQAEQPAGCWGAEGMRPTRRRRPSWGQDPMNSEKPAAVLGRSTAKTRYECVQGR
jgi:hypothetical protein